MPTKGTITNYNSRTWFGSFFGAYNSKVIMLIIYCRRCRIYESAKRKLTPVHKHNCVQNYQSDHSSTNMEAADILNIAMDSVSTR